MSSAWTFLTQPLITAQKNAGMTVDVAFDTDVKSTTWDGGTSLSGGKDTGATAGYLIDFETGAAQFQTIYAEGGSLGTLDVDGTITMGSGGAIKTASSGQRIEITNTGKNRIIFYSGDADEEYAAQLAEATNGTGATRTVQAAIFSPYINVNDQGVSLTVRSASANATSFAPAVIIATTAPNDPGTGSGLAPQFIIQNGIKLSTDGDIALTAGDLSLTAGAIQLWGLGTAAAPAIGIGTNYDDGMYSSTDGTLNFTTSGVQRFNVNSTRITCSGVDYFRFPGKSTTGDPASPANGDMYVNHTDKLLRLYANGAWKTVLSW